MIASLGLLITALFSGSGDTLVTRQFGGCVFGCHCLDNLSRKTNFDARNR